MSLFRFNTRSSHIDYQTLRYLDAIRADSVFEFTLWAKKLLSTLSLSSFMKYVGF
jgi:hypothetical protein